LSGDAAESMEALELAIRAANDHPALVAAGTAKGSESMSASARIVRL
jgi:hypothetical protein